MNERTILIVLLLADRWRSNARAVVFRHRTAVRILAKAICFGLSRCDVTGTLSVHFSNDHMPQLSLLSYYTAYVRANRQEIPRVF